MTRVYLTEQGSVGHKRGGRLEVEKDGLSLLRLPLEQVEQLVVVGRGVQLSTSLLVDLIQRGIEIAFLSRSGRYYGKALGAPNGATAMRAAQYAYLGDTNTATAFVRMIVTQKLAAQAQQLGALGDGVAAARVARAAGDLARARSIDQIRGHEGAAAAAYWQAIGRRLPAAWGFSGRRH